MLNRVSDWGRSLMRQVRGPQDADAVDELATSMAGVLRRATNSMGLALPGATSDGGDGDGEVLFGKNNVCVHGSATSREEAGTPLPRSPDEEHHPGYLNVRCQRDPVLGKTFILTWTPNATIQKNPGSFQTTPEKSPEAAMGRSSQQSPSSEVGHPVPGASEPPSATASELGFTVIDSPSECGACLDKKDQLSLNLTSVLVTKEPPEVTKEPPEVKIDPPATPKEPAGAGDAPTGEDELAGAEIELCEEREQPDSGSTSPSTSGPDSPSDSEPPGVPQDVLVSPVKNSSSSREGIRDPGCGIFSVDLGRMRNLRFFYAEDGSSRSGHLVIASPESQYKVLHFHNGGMEKLEEVLKDWRFLSRQKSKASDRICQQYTVMRPSYVPSERHPEEGQHGLVTAEVWRSFVNSSGQIEDVVGLRKAIFFGGLEPTLRGVAWPFLLKYFAFESTWEERDIQRNDCFLEYQQLRARRAGMPESEQKQFYNKVQSFVEKDVVRTDRKTAYYEGEDNVNVQVLKEILLNYAVAHPETGYMQGMSDLLAPILAEVRDEMDAFWCFEGLMQRTIFVSSPKDSDMDRQLNYLWALLSLMAPDFHQHLSEVGGGAEDLLFCHRWILLCFKREFSEQDSLCIWDACWSHYQTDFFHLFVSVAIIQIYGARAVRESLTADDMLLFFTSLSGQMNVQLVLKQARFMMHEFRSRSTIPCWLSSICRQCGPGMWDSGHVPNVRCVGHPDGALCPHQDSPTSPV